MGVGDHFKFVKIKCWFLVYVYSTCTLLVYLILPDPYYPKTTIYNVHCIAWYLMNYQWSSAAPSKQALYNTCIIILFKKNGRPLAPCCFLFMYFHCFSTEDKTWWWFCFPEWQQHSCYFLSRLILNSADVDFNAPFIFDQVGISWQVGVH